jgi:3'-phosphoadenosine 5'-phosphosulfate sulfotransferase (PAPS reductase)/FAD synthetase
MSKPHNFENSFVAFSGGKDSVAVSKYVREELGLKLPHVAVVNLELDYEEHIKFIHNYCYKNNIDLRLQILKNRGIDYVKQNPKFIFPFDSKIKGEWFRKFQQYGIKKYAKDNGYNLIIYGRRIADGNNIKKEYYKTADGLSHYFPLRDWSNEHTQFYILNEPHTPIYNTPEGYRRGTHTINIANEYNGTDELGLNLVRSINEDKAKIVEELLKIKYKN